jgi:hypothetical protein
MSNEERYKTAVSQHLGPINLIHEGSQKTPHYTANSYRLVSSSFEEPVNLNQYHFTNPAEKTIDVVTHLYQSNLAAWNGIRQTFSNQEKTINDFYEGWLQDQAPDTTDRQWPHKVEAICIKSSSRGLGQIDYSAQVLTYHLPFETSPVRLPNPITYLNDKRSARQLFVQWGIIHGRVNLETVLVDTNGRSWLIDFTQMGKGPLLHDFVALETAVKQNLPAAATLHDRYLLEHNLAALLSLNDSLDDDDLPLITRESARLIITIRQLAADLIGCSLDTYLIGLYYHAMQYVAEYKPDIHYPLQSLLTCAHTLLSAGLQCEKLSEPPNIQIELPDQAAQTLWIDKINKAVWVEGMLIELTLQDFQILTYLFDHANQLCERHAIITEGLGEANIDYYEEESRINSAMSRLRQKIEPNPKNPKYLITVRGRGYKLVL